MNLKVLFARAINMYVNIFYYYPSGKPKYTAIGILSRYELRNVVAEMID